MNFQPIKGVITPMLTPFSADGAVNLDMIKPLTSFLLEHGIKGLFPLGTTGEGVLLSLEERKQVAEATVKAVDEAVPVIIHTGAITTAEALLLTHHAQSIGADAVAIVAPYYFRHTPQALEQHYRTLLEAVPDFPVYLYNFPAVTGNTLSLALVMRLADDYDNLVGLKDSSGDLQTMFETDHLHNGDFNTAIGPDHLILAGLAMGLDACVSGHSNVIPDIVVGLYNATTTGDIDQARNLQEKLNSVREILHYADLSIFKGVLSHRGLQMGGVRPPLLTASQDEINHCIQQLEQAGIFK